MNTKKFKEILEQSTHIDSVADYEIRRYTNSGGYVIIATLGDFVILDEYNVADVCSIIFEDLIDQGKITQN